MNHGNRRPLAIEEVSKSSGVLSIRNKVYYTPAGASVLINTW